MGIQLKKRSAGIIPVLATHSHRGAHTGMKPPEMACSLQKEQVGNASGTALFSGLDVLILSLQRKQEKKAWPAFCWNRFIC